MTVLDILVADDVFVQGLQPDLHVTSGLLCIVC
jgi:hypothetical protein